MTEDQAKTKWCPFARVSDTEEHPASVNRHWGDGQPERGTYCLASGCMMWEWRIEHPISADVSPDGYCSLSQKR